MNNEPKVREVLIRARNLEKSYHDGTRTLQVLRKVDFDLKKGEAVAIVGQSGSGKEHPAQSAQRSGSARKGIDSPRRGGSGDDERLQTEPGAARQDRAGLSVSPPHARTARVGRTWPCPPCWARVSRAEARKRAFEMLERVGMADRANHVPAKLSGGEQQRVSIARSLMNDPMIVLADEPTGNLDVETAREVIQMLWEMTRSKGRSLVIVTHEPSIAKKADRILRLQDGRLADVTEG